VSSLMVRVLVTLGLLFSLQPIGLQAQALTEDTYHRFFSDPTFNWTDSELFFEKYFRFRNNHVLNSESVIERVHPAVRAQIEAGRKFGEEYLKILQEESAAPNVEWIADPFRQVELTIKKFHLEQRRKNEAPASRQALEMTARGMRVTRYPGVESTGGGSDIAREAREYENEQALTLSEFLTEQRPTQDLKSDFSKLIENLIAKVEGLRTANMDIAIRRSPNIRLSFKGESFVSVKARASFGRILQTPMAPRLAQLEFLRAHGVRAEDMSSKFSKLYKNSPASIRSHELGLNIVNPGTLLINGLRDSENEGMDSAIVREAMFRELQLGILQAELEAIKEVSKKRADLNEALRSLGRADGEADSTVLGSLTGDLSEHSLHSRLKDPVVGLKFWGHLHALDFWKRKAIRAETIGGRSVLREDAKPTRNLIVRPLARILQASLRRAAVVAVTTALGIIPAAWVMETRTMRPMVEKVEQTFQSTKIEVIHSAKKLGQGVGDMARSIADKISSIGSDGIAFVPEDIWTSSKTQKGFQDPEEFPDDGSKYYSFQSVPPGYDFLPLVPQAGAMPEGFDKIFEDLEPWKQPSIKLDDEGKAYAHPLESKLAQGRIFNIPVPQSTKEGRALQLYEVKVTDLETKRDLEATEIEVLKPKYSSSYIQVRVLGAGSKFGFKADFLSPDNENMVVRSSSKLREALLSSADIQSISDTLGMHGFLVAQELASEATTVSDVARATEFGAFYAEAPVRGAPSHYEADENLLATLEQFQRGGLMIGQCDEGNFLFTAAIRHAEDKTKDGRKIMFVPMRGFMIGPKGKLDIHMQTLLVDVENKDFDWIDATPGDASGAVMAAEQYVIKQMTSGQSFSGAMGAAYRQFVEPALSIQDAENAAKIKKGVLGRWSQTPIMPVTWAKNPESLEVPSMFRDLDFMRTLKVVGKSDQEIIAAYKSVLESRNQAEIDLFEGRLKWRDSRVDLPLPKMFEVAVQAENQESALRIAKALGGAHDPYAKTAMEQIFLNNILSPNNVPDSMFLLTFIKNSSLETWKKILNLRDEKGLPTYSALYLAFSIVDYAQEDDWQQVREQVLGVLEDGRILTKSFERQFLSRDEEARRLSSQALKVELLEGISKGTFVFEHEYEEALRVLFRFYHDDPAVLKLYREISNGPNSSMKLFVRNSYSHLYFLTPKSLAEKIRLDVQDHAEVVMDAAIVRGIDLNWNLDMPIRFSGIEAKRH